MNVQNSPITSQNEGISLNRKLIAVALLLFMLLIVPVSAYAAPQQQNPACLNDPDPCNDLGDAPDGTNNHGAPMSAYPGVPANFPTVFGQLLGQPNGPKHDRPRLLFLGDGVTLEREADMGFDWDPTNNIWPPSNASDLDLMDDGIQANQWGPGGNCQPSSFEVRVTITPQAVAIFSEDFNGTAYLNAWLDNDRDGDWADETTCTQNGVGLVDSLEHTIIDFPIDVVGLGAGTHTLIVPTGIIYWPPQMAQRPTWARFTLSEKVSNKTLPAANPTYGDGRGYTTEFKFGETEDFELNKNWNNNGDPAGIQAASLNSQSMAPEVDNTLLFIPLVQQ